MKHLKKEYNHPNPDKNIEFLDKMLFMISSIRSDMILYRSFASRGMDKEAQISLDHSVMKFEKMQEICKDMKKSISLHNKEEVTKTTSYGEIIVLEKFRKVA